LQTVIPNIIVRLIHENGVLLVLWSLVMEKQRAIFVKKKVKKKLFLLDIFKNSICF